MNTLTLNQILCRVYDGTPATRTWPERMGKVELRSYIDACHRARSYDSYFEAAVREWNTRYR